jgi:hypothetical protein
MTTLVASPGSATTAPSDCFPRTPPHKTIPSAFTMVAHMLLLSPPSDVATAPESAVSKADSAADQIEKRDRRGAPAMRGLDTRQEGMFSYISPESRIPNDHPLRPIREMVDDAPLERKEHAGRRARRRLRRRWRLPAERDRAAHAARRAAADGLRARRGTRAPPARPDRSRGAPRGTAPRPAPVSLPLP